MSDFSKLLEKVRQALSGDKKPAKPAPPKRPASFYDPPEGAPDSFTVDDMPPPSGESTGMQASATPHAMSEFKDSHAKPDVKDAPAMPRFKPPPAMPVLPIPANVASVVAQGGRVTLVYSPRRKLGMAIVVLVVGTIIAAFGALALIGGSSWTVPLVLLVVGLLIDLGGVQMIVSSLEIVASGGKLQVEQRGLFGRKQFDAAGAAIEIIDSTVSYTVTSGSKRTHYYTLTAHTQDGRRIPVGYSVPGEAVADAIAYRIAGALGLAPTVVASLLHHFPDDDDPGS